MTENTSPSGPKIIWVASYPKSGNTWVRFILANLLSEPPVTSDDVDKLIPDMHVPNREPILRSERDTVFVKTHCEFSKLAILTRRTSACIYIVRHPLDVLASNLHYLLKNTDTSSQNAVIETFIQLGGVDAYVKRGFGTWKGHYYSWKSQIHSFPIKILRYEDLLQDPLKHVADMAKFLKINASAERIAKATEASSFGSLSKIERLEQKKGGADNFVFGEMSKSGIEGRYFINRGQSYYFREYLTDEQIRLWMAKYGRTMRALGYGP